MTNVRVAFDIELTDEEERLLRNIISEINPQQTFEEILAEFAKASLEEYYRMFMGQKVFTRGSDIKEYRLYLLIKIALQDRIPDEELVSSLFQMTSSESRSLIRSVTSKYQYDLQEAVNKSLVDTIRNAEGDIENGQVLEYTLDIKTESIVKELNKRLGNIDGNLPQIKKKQGTYSKYTITVSSFARLRNQLLPNEEEAMAEQGAS